MPLAKAAFIKVDAVGRTLEVEALPSEAVIAAVVAETRGHVESVGELGLADRLAVARGVQMDILERVGAQASPVSRTAGGGLWTLATSYQLLDERGCEPLVVPLWSPVPVDDEEPVDLWGHERMDEVNRVVFLQAFSE